MEKPSPTYDISSRFTRQMRGDSEQHERYIDRMTLRGIQVIGDTDGEGDAPVWRGDHSFNSEAATYSLMHFIEPEVALEHPDWSHAQVHEHAVDRFKARLAQDLSYEHKEAAHEESVVRWRPIQTSTGSVELATEYGGKMVTLSQLWEHTKEYSEFVGNPQAYNKQEHEAQLLMQDKLVHGSSNGFVSVLSHPDAVRYVQVWQKSESGDVISQQIDLYATTGKDFSSEEAKDLMHHLSEFHGKSTQEDRPQETNSYAHFFVTKGSIYAEDIRTIAIAQFAGDKTVSYARETRTVRSQEQISHNPAIADAAHSVSRIAAYVRDQIEDKIQALKQKNSVPYVRKTDTKPIRIEPGNSKNSLRVTKEGKHSPAGEKKITVISPEKSSSLVDPKSILSEWWITQTMIAYGPVLPVASVATMHWFAFLGEAEKNIEKRLKSGAPEILRNHIKKERISSGSPVEIMWRAFITRMNGVLGGSPREKVGLMTSVPELHRTDTFIQGKRYSGIEKNTIPAQKNVPQWVEVMQVLARLFFLPLPAPYPRSDQDKRRIAIPDVATAQENTLEHRTIITGRFIFALILSWIVSYPARSEVPHANKTKKAHRDSVRDTEATGAQGETVQAPWIMLAIIRYLVLLRESGQPGVQVAVPQTNGGRPKRKRRKGDLPQRGIIFAFAS